jgi:cell division protease FtsH
MVCEWGMSDRLGPLSVGRKNEQIFLGKELAYHRDFSESTAQLIDDEITRIVNESRQKAEDLLNAHSATFETIAKNLIERETLNAEEIGMIMKGESLPAAGNGDPKEADADDTVSEDEKTVE